MTLTQEDLERYHRQILFRSFGREGQGRLKDAHVLVAGVGGLGSPAAMYLCAGGIGHLSLVDEDTVSLSNLNRQLLYWERDIGKRKVASAEEKLLKMNSSVRIIPIHEKITDRTCKVLLEDVDVAVDCLDTMTSRYALNRACVENRIPLIHGGVYGMMGQLTSFLPDAGPCFECIFPQGEESKKPTPILGPAAGFIASLQVLEVIKLLTGTGKLLTGRLLYFNAELMACSFADVSRRVDCPVCGDETHVPV
jgi:adenylyltransferase/sulfurtransferase